MRTPARKSADAIVSPGSMRTLRPSNSRDAMNLVRACVAFDSQHATTARKVEPALALKPRFIASHPHALKIDLDRIGLCRRNRDLALEPVFGIRAETTVGALDEERRQLTFFLTTGSTICDGYAPECWIRLWATMPSFSSKLLPPV